MCVLFASQKCDRRLACFVSTVGLLLVSSHCTAHLIVLVLPTGYQFVIFLRDCFFRKMRSSLQITGIDE